MSLDNRYSLTWSETAEVLGFDDEGLRQAMLVHLRDSDRALWLPVSIDSKGGDFFLQLVWDMRNNPMVKIPSLSDHHGVNHDAGFADGSTFSNRGETATASWEVTFERDSGHGTYYLLSGQLILAPQTVRRACENLGELRGDLLRLAPREWCKDGFPIDKLYFYLLDRGSRFATVESLYTDALFHAVDVLRTKAALAADRNAAMPAKSSSESSGGRSLDRPLLADLEAAWEKLWANYNPDEPDTAPTNEQVVDWLVKNRGTARRNAEIIATMLRPRTLRPGPRK